MKNKDYVEISIPIDFTDLSGAAKRMEAFKVAMPECRIILTGQWQKEWDRTHSYQFDGGNVSYCGYGSSIRGRFILGHETWAGNYKSYEIVPSQGAEATATVRFPVDSVEVHRWSWLLSTD